MLKNTVKWGLVINTEKHKWQRTVKTGWTVWNVNVWWTGKNRHVPSKSNNCWRTSSTVPLTSLFGEFYSDSFRTVSPNGSAYVCCICIRIFGWKNQRQKRSLLTRYNLRILLKWLEIGSTVFVWCNVVTTPAPSVGVPQIESRSRCCRQVLY